MVGTMAAGLRTADREGRVVFVEGCVKHEPRCLDDSIYPLIEALRPFSSKSELQIVARLLMLLDLLVFIS